MTTTTPTRTTSSPSCTTTGATVSGSGPGSTLQPGYSWIRAVAAPNYHKYLQTSPLNASPGRAILADNKSAGQYKLLDGQLVELIDKTGTVLYANVGEQPNASATYLPVTFTTTKNTFGKFAFQGDTLTWSAEGIKRPNVAAWYVCEGKSLWINLGAYLYGTPAGCADQTVSILSGFWEAENGLIGANVCRFIRMATRLLMRRHVGICGATETHADDPFDGMKRGVDCCSDFCGERFSVTLLPSFRPPSPIAW